MIRKQQQELALAHLEMERIVGESSVSNTEPTAKSMEADYRIFGEDTFNLTKILDQVCVLGCGRVCALRAPVASSAPSLPHPPPCSNQQPTPSHSARRCGRHHVCCATVARAE